MLRGFLLSLVAVGLSILPGVAQTGSSVLVVANANSPDSLRIAEEYARARAVPPDQILRVDVDAAADDVDRSTYDRSIQTPIADWLTRHFAQDRILYIVLTKGVPLRIKGTAGRNGTVTSVDSELAMLYRRLSGVTVLVPGPQPNPYYLAERPVAQAKPFSRADQDIYLVTRLDGFTVDDALALVERASRASRDGKFVLDEKAGLGEPGGDPWLKAATDWLVANGFGNRVVHDATTRVVTGEENVLGYYSWGSNDPAVDSRAIGMRFVPGALAGTFVSTDARTFREPPPDWKPAAWSERTKYFAGSPQSLVGDLIRAGVTAVSGSVAEPYLDSTIRPQILFPAYLSGFNIAESYYLAMPSLSWQTIVIGDPLCAPFSEGKTARPEPSDAVDPVTLLPKFFSARSAAATAEGGARPEAIPLMLRAQALSAKDDKAGAQKALEEATALDPRLNAAHLLLATTYEAQREWDKAIARYRQMLTNKPGNPVALNNLAYDIAVHKGQPAEALTYAERAYAYSPSPLIADTLAWIHHLLGRDDEAARLLAEAVRKLPDNAEVRLHAAVVFAAVGMLDAAAKELADAVRLDPALARRDEAARVRRLTGK